MNNPFVENAITCPANPQKNVNGHLKTVAEFMTDAGVDALKEDSTSEEMSTAINRFSNLTVALDPVLRGAAQSDLIKKLKAVGVNCPTEIAKKAFRISESEPEDGQGRILKFNDPEPFDGPVDLGDLLDEISSTLKRYIVLPAGSDAGIALWIIHVWCLNAFDLSPLLRIESPVKGCGKTSLLILVGELLPRSFSTANMTTANAYRMVDKFSVSLCIDEVDQSLKNNEELIALVNSGYTRKTAQVPRCEGDKNEVKVFNSFCGKLLAGIGKLPGTTDSRSIKIHLKKKTKMEQVERLLFHELDVFGSIKSRCARIALDYTQALRLADPKIPEKLGDRDSDNWRPLLSIADLAGGEWPDRARKAALVLATDSDGEDGPAVQLLEDMRDLFLEGVAERLPSDEVVSHLATLEHRPWPEWRNGRPISPRGVAWLLSRFEIKPKQFKISGTKTRGYEERDFIEAWGRYLNDTPGTDLENRDLSDYKSGTPGEQVPFEKQDNAFKNNRVPVEPDGIPVSGGMKEKHGGTRATDPLFEESL